MIKLYRRYLPNEEIDIHPYVTKRKLIKYYTRDVMAAMVCMGELRAIVPIASDTPFFFSSGESERSHVLENRDELLELADTSSSVGEFISKTSSKVSPLVHFKTMRNMAHCFISIEYQLKGDNAALVGSLSGLLASALMADCLPNSPILIGASKLNYNNIAEAGVALITQEELKGNPFLNSEREAISFFRE